jgi:hypothetical protein
MSRYRTKKRRRNTRGGDVYAAKRANDSRPAISHRPFSPVVRGEKRGRRVRESRAQVPPDADADTYIPAHVYTDTRDVRHGGCARALAHAAVARSRDSVPGGKAEVGSPLAGSQVHCT